MRTTPVRRYAEYAQRTCRIRVVAWYCSTREMLLLVISGWPVD